MKTQWGMGNSIPHEKIYQVINLIPILQELH